MVEFDNLHVRKDGDMYVISSTNHELKVAAPLDMQKYEADGNVHEGSYLRIVIDYCTRIPEAPTTESCFLAHAQKRRPEVSIGSSLIRA